MRYRSSVDRLIGSMGVVIIAIPQERTGVGTVKVNGQQWSAVTDNPESIPIGSKVWVSARDHVILIVVPEPG
jgi:membrane protein implicated in regulation of membrane protease activity